MSKRKIEVIDINPKIRKEDAKHFMIVYFDVEVDQKLQNVQSSTGHTYFELRDESIGKSDFFGKNPSERAPVYSGKISDEQDRKERAEQYTEKSGETVLVAKSLPLTKEQYDKPFGIEVRLA